GQPPRTLAGAGRDEPRQAARLPLDVGDGRVEVVREPDERQRLLPRLVVDGAGAGLPVADDALDEPVERRHGSGDVEGAHVEGAGEAADVVDVHVRHGGRHDRAVLVVDGVVEEGEVEVGHRAIAARWADAGGRTANGLSPPAIRGWWGR